MNDYRVLSTGAKIPIIGLGTFGSDKYTPEQVADAVYRGIKGGYRLLDCAAVYQNEEQIGQVIHRVINEGIVKRNELFIVSKVWNDMHGEGKVIESCKKSMMDLQVDYLDLFLIHWPFSNYHAPGCSGDSRNPDSKPFSAEAYMVAWRQCEKLVEEGLVKNIGMSNMSIRKLEQILPLCNIRPAVLEMELHPAFQQPELFEYAMLHGIRPIGFCPIGSPSRPDRDRCDRDIAATQMPVICEIAEKHQIHPALVCLKWAVQRGQIPIPFAVKQEQLYSNLHCAMEDLLTDEEMKAIDAADKQCRLIKGQVFLWPEAKDWTDLWD